MDGNLFTWVSAIGIPLIYALGFLGALDAIMETRTAQGATAWALALISFPFLALPLYWFFGRAKFDEYIQTIRKLEKQPEALIFEALQTKLHPWIVDLEQEENERTRGELQAFRRLSTLNFTHGNKIELLVNGQATFDAILEGIDAARRFVLVQFYIIHDDNIGQKLKSSLIAALGRGVQVFLLFDEVGSHGLPRRYLRELKTAGARVSGVHGPRSWLGRFRLNFRNHKKVVVVDGKWAFMGGLNVGDEYLDGNPKLSPWRDTHVVVQGPAVLGFQYSFIRDWYYSQQETPDLEWAVEPSGSDQQVLILASGPADPLETCGLLFTHAIESAEERLWIASPYFVPDSRVIGALQLAALRGVDVRVMVPRNTDNFLFKFAPYAYLPQIERAGVKIYLYDEGFMHQKVFLVDDAYGAVSSANFDNRSFRYNFEITCLVNDKRFCKNIEEMLLQDFSKATRLHGEMLENRSFAFRLAAQITRLLAPVL